MKKTFPMIILLGCAVLLAYGVVQLFKLRFETGDVYPMYSSLRADPLGTMAFYESLGKMSGITVRRDFSASNRQPEHPQTTYFHLAAEPHEWEFLPDDLFREMKGFLNRGGRLVIAYFPQTKAPHQFLLDDEDKTNSVTPMSPKSNGKKTIKGRQTRKKENSLTKVSVVNLEDQWGFHEGFAPLQPTAESYAPEQVGNKTDLELPRVLNWHSGMIFTNCNAGWRTVYARGTNAVVVERNFGKGSVVLASDSYFLSNESLFIDPHADLLAWLVGTKQEIVFDEAHLGIVDTSGVVMLMRKYRLYGLAAGLLLLAGLFVWKNSTSLVPPAEEERQENFAVGKNAAFGFVNLLRRNIAPREIFTVCFTEWKRYATASGKFSSARLQQAEAIFQAENVQPPKNRDPLAAYQKISETLGKRQQKI